MEQLHLLASSSKAATTIPFYLALDHTVSTSTSPPEAAQAPPYPAFDPSRQSNLQERGLETLKAKITSHPLYPALLSAFTDCRKTGAPSEIVGRLSSLADELESNSDDRHKQPADPELDQFMETYCDMLLRYRQELTKPIQEADEFFRSMEAQINSLALGAYAYTKLFLRVSFLGAYADTVALQSFPGLPIFQADDTRCERGGSSEDQQETGDVAGLPAITSPSDEDKELKNQLLNKYSGYLSNLSREISNKKKKGKLPRDARQKLLQWYRLHYIWPYPSELEKAALAVSTGLDAKQINNWFINQRKRHWKPTPPAAMDYSSQPTYGAQSSSSAALRMEARQYFTGGSAYPRW